MTADMWITLVILIVMMVLFVSEKLRVDLVALCVVLALTLTGIVTAEEAMAGFSSTSVLSIAFLFVVGGAVFQTGLAAAIGDAILKIAGTNQTRLLMIMMLTVSSLSAFISSTGVVALMLPAVMSVAQRAKIPASKLGIPLAFSALIGGTTTLIATPPNIIVSEVMQDAGYPPFEFFSYTLPGVLLVVAWLAYMLTIGRRLLPERKPDTVVQRMETPAELFTLYQLPDNMYRLRVPSQSNLIGTSIAASRLGSDFNIAVASLSRMNESRRIGSRSEQTVQYPEADTVFQEDDVLVVQGDIRDITRAAGYWNLAIMANHPIQEGDVITNEVGIAEMVLRPRSSLNGKSLSELQFGSAYHLTVLNLRRPGAHAPLDLKTTPLKFGDVLLVQGRWKDIYALKRLRHDFIVMGEPEAAEMGAFLRLTHAPITLTILVLMIVVLALDLLPLTVASLLAAVAVVLTGCLSMDEAYESIDLKSLILIAGMLPMGTALVKVGLADAAADLLIQTVGELGPLYVLAGLFILTLISTQIISNTASALLVAPIALAAAQGLNVNPQAFMMSVAIAAAMALLSPVASPVNMLVMSPGNYRFSDFARVGAPMMVIAFIISMIVLPVMWPF